MGGMADADDELRARAICALTSARARDPGPEVPAHLGEARDGAREGTGEESHGGESGRERALPFCCVLRVTRVRGQRAVSRVGRLTESWRKRACSTRSWTPSAVAAAAALRLELVPLFDDDVQS
jgi:hypothetical protein